MEFLSHIRPDRYLYQHLKEVSQKMTEFLEQAPATPLLAGDDIEKLFRYTGLAHDFGKHTTFFQKKLKAEYTGREADHGFISALFAFYLLRFQAGLSDNNPYPLFSYLAVLNHHGNLRNVDDDTGIRLEDNRSNKEKQLQDLKDNLEEIEDNYSRLGLEISLQDFIDRQDELMSEISRQGFSYSYGNYDFTQKTEYHQLVVYLYSSLIDADKRHAARVDKDGRREISAFLVDEYKEKKFAGAPDNEMNRLREEIYEKVIDKINKMPLEQKIMSFTAPTGSGKTLTAFSAALKLRKRVTKESGTRAEKGPPRIIYSLPFTSIIDQNYQVLSEVMALIENYAEAPQEYIIKHHHLADVGYKGSEGDLPLDEALMLIESWESEVVVTTFIQLLHTLIGYKNSFLKKYHNIAGSIIILDEVQNIPVVYWDLMQKIFQVIAEQLDCYVILLTATRPLIFKENIEELLTEKDKFFASMSRTELKPRLEDTTIAEFIKDFEQKFSQDKSHLVVMNTIKSSEKVYEELKEKLHLYPGKDIFYISTNIYPAQRRERLEKISEKLADNEKIVVVSTQVVEAGVDIDMDVIYRDLGPVDSLIQIAGRGNREAGKGRSPVFIYNLKKDEESSRSFCSLVYGSVHRNVSKDILADKGLIEEKDFKDLVESYFTKIKEAQSGLEESKKLIAACAELKFSQTEPSLAQFQLIEDKPSYLDMFVITEDSREIWQAFKEKVIEEKDYQISRSNFLALKQKFYSYIISVPVKLAKNYIDHNNNFRGVFAANCDLEHYYNSETGFIHKESSWNVDNRIL